MPRRSLSLIPGMLFVLGFAVGCDRGNRYAPPPPAEVTVRTPSKKSVQTYLEYSGVIRAKESIALPARVQGVLKERLYQEGAEVKADQLLLVIDETEFKAKVEEAAAALADANANLVKSQTSQAREVATAQLALDKASLLLAQLELSRQRSLISRNAASQQDIDRADATTKKSAAQVQSDEASLAQAKADYDVNIESAKAKISSADAKLKLAVLDLSYCRIKAPVNGRVSRSIRDVGNLVGGPQTMILANILQEDEVYAYMDISEGDLLRFRAQRRSGERPDFLKETIPLDLGLMDEKGFPHKGRVNYASPGVDPTTGTIEARGLFPNPDRQLIDGAFARIRVPYQTRKDALLIPDEAIGSDATGRYVLVVNAENKVAKKFVEIGPQAEGERVIETGLEAGDRVIIVGIQKARPGDTVKPIESTATVKASSPPTPASKPEKP